MGLQRVRHDLVTKQQQGQQLYKTRMQSTTELSIHLSRDRQLHLGGIYQEK